MDERESALEGAGGEDAPSVVREAAAAASAAEAVLERLPNRDLDWIRADARFDSLADLEAARQASLPGDVSKLEVERPTLEKLRAWFTGLGADHRVNRRTRRVEAEVAARGFGVARVRGRGRGAVVAGDD